MKAHVPALLRLRRSLPLVLERLLCESQRDLVIDLSRDPEAISDQLGAELGLLRSRLGLRQLHDQAIDKFDKFLVRHSPRVLTDRFTQLGGPLP